MAILNVKIDDKLDESFRKQIQEKYGYKKGNITKAVHEVLIKWIIKDMTYDEMIDFFARMVKEETGGRSD